MSQRTKTILAGIAIVVAAAAVYSDSFSGPFIFDDIPAIRENATIRSLRSAKVLIPPGNVTVARRPLANLSFAVNYAIGKLAVRSYHAANLLIHLLAALTLFGILRRTLLLPALRDRFGGASTGLAAAVALIWALHPLQTESVTYIVQRVESLMGLCYLLTLYALIRGAASERPRPWYAASVVACALGMGAKEVIATAPVVVLLYDRMFLSGSFRETFRRRGGLYLGLAATWAVLGSMMLLYKGSGASGFGVSVVTPWQYARTQFGVIVHYLALSFRPWPLCLDYGWPVAWDLWDILPPALIVLALAGATIACLRRASPLAFLGIWFFVILAPTSSIMPIRDLCFEHRMYLPLAAVIALVVTGAYALGRRAIEFVVPAEHPQSRRRLGTAVAALSCLVVAAFLGSLTFLRNQFYQNDATIWKDVTIHQPRNARAFFNLGSALAAENQNEEAIQCFLHALQIKQGYPATRNNLGLTLTESGRAAAHNKLGIALSEVGRYEEAMGNFVEGLSLQPDDAPAQCYFGNTLVALGKAPEAIAHYRKAIQLNPEFADAHYNLARALADQGHADEAIIEYEEALRLAPDNGQAHNNLGRLLALQGHAAEALAHYREALRLLPDAPVVRANLAWLRATCPDPKFRDAGEALRLARGQAGAGNARALDVLAAACAEAGLFDEAVTAARQAIEAAEHSGEKTAAAEIRARLNLYESRRPYRERVAGKATRIEP
jgi:tetratricopeptide (TPR) repeat protein